MYNCKPVVCAQCSFTVVCLLARSLPATLSCLFLSCPVTPGFLSPPAQYLFLLLTNGSCCKQMPAAVITAAAGVPRRAAVLITGMHHRASFQGELNKGVGKGWAGNREEEAGACICTRGKTAHAPRQKGGERREGAADCSKEDCEALLLHLRRVFALTLALAALLAAAAAAGCGGPRSPNAGLDGRCIAFAVPHHWRLAILQHPAGKQSEQ